MTSKDKWSIQNRNHIALSDSEAELYDEEYAENNYQTRQYMKFEEGILLNVVSQVLDTGLAIDLGCGTGRDLFKYADKFDSVIGWDFSEKMIEVTARKAKENGYSNVIAEVRDVEKEGFAGIKTGSVGFINAGFGMGSFIRDLPKFTCDVHRVLSDGGTFMTTFYNKDSIVQFMDSKCFAAIPDVENNTLTVDTGNNQFVIPCISYTVNELKDIFSKQFEITALYTYPTISTIVSNGVLNVPQIKKAIIQLEEAAKESLWGHYIVLLCRKK